MKKKVTEAPSRSMGLCLRVVPFPLFTDERLTGNEFRVIAFVCGSLLGMSDDGKLDLAEIAEQLHLERSEVEAAVAKAVELSWLAPDPDDRYPGAYMVPTLAGSEESEQ